MDIGLQETRLPQASCYESQGWFCVNSACEASGQGGCSLWINQSQPWSNRLAVVKASHVHVVVSEPRILIVRVCTPGIAATLVVAHSPHSKRPTVERDAFWARMHKLVRHATQFGDELFLSVDANGRLGSSDGSGLCFKGESSSANGLALSDFAEAFDLCAPALGPCHVGPEHTWISPSGFKRRIDCVLGPKQFCGGAVTSRTLLDFEWAGLEHDHFPVVVKFAISKERGVPAAVLAARRLPVPELPEGFALDLPPAQWSLGVDAHLDFFTKEVRQVCARFGRRACVQPRRSYITAEVFQLVHLKRHLTRTVRAWAETKRLTVLWCCVQAWKSSDFGHPAEIACQVAFADTQVAVHWRALGNATHELKSCLRSAKVSKLQALAQEFVDTAWQGNFKDLFRAIQPFRVGARGKSRFRPTPCVLDQRGEPCVDASQVAQVWSRHFGDIEGGDVVSPMALCRDYRTEVAGRDPGTMPPISLRDLPTRAEWEAQFHGLKAGKAPGADGLSHDVIARLGQCVPQESYALALKTAVTGSEPLRWRGGLVTALYKGKGSLSDVGSFRSILISEVLAKRHHAWARQKLEPWLTSVAHSMQQGPVGHHSTPEMSLLVRSVQSHSHDRGISVGCLFVDITAAFYSVLREFLLPNHADVGSLVSLCDKLGFSADATGDVLQGFASQSDPCISAVWQARVSDVLRHTWFQVLGSSSCVATRRGSRPGDPLADLLYGIVMAQALTEIQQHFESAGLSLASSQAGILPGVLVEDSVIPAAGAWQDDAVFFVAVRSCADLLPKCREAIRIVHTAFAVRGLTVNYKPSKTELLLCPVGAGSRAVKRQIYQQLPFPTGSDTGHGACCLRSSCA